MTSRALVQSIPSKPPARPLPAPSAWSEPFWQAARERRLVIQYCADCNTPILYPRRFCPACLGEHLHFRPAKGTGEIYTLTTQLAAAPSGFEALLPYVIAVIRLDEGVQLMSNLVGDNAQSARIGDRVIVDFQDMAGSNITLPVFRLMENAR